MDGAEETRAFATDLSGLTFADAPDGVSGETWIQVCRDGKWKHPAYGAVTITPKVRAAFVRNFSDNVRKSDLPVDYNHQSDTGPAAGWIRAVENRGDALFARVDLTPKAREAVKAPAKVAGIENAGNRRT